MKRWNVEGDDAGAFRIRSSLKSFVLGMTLRATLLAIAASVVLMFAASSLGLLEAGARQFLIPGALTLVINGAVALWISARAGRVIIRLARSNARFEQLSRTDALSGLLNRRAFAEALASASDGMSLAIIDVDRFKSINDSYGHSTGDAVIRRVAELISQTTGCLAGRLGGEEFGVLLRGGTMDGRIALVEAMRGRIEAEVFLADDLAFRVTISAGIAEVERGRPTDVTYAAADKALYLAKAGGRNRVVHDREGLNLILDIVAGERMEIAASGNDYLHLSA